MPTIKEMLEAAAKKKAAGVSEEKEKSSTRDILYGTGLTKRTIESENRAREKVLLRSTEVNQDLDPIAAIERLHRAKAAAIEHPVSINLENAGTVAQIKAQANYDRLDESQKYAVDNILKHQYACLIGAAGVGKSFTVRVLLEKLIPLLPEIDFRLAIRNGLSMYTEEIYTPAIAFCAFTGKAVENLKKNIPNEYQKQCMTIHATLGYAPEYEYRMDPETGKEVTRMIFTPTFTRYNKLPYKAIVVDESGMLGTNLFEQLMEALSDDCRIYLVGDINQLPPVHDTSILGYAMLHWPVYELTKIHRTAQDNPIIMNAHKVLKGATPIPDKKNFMMVEISDSSVDASGQIIALLRKLKSNGNFDPFRDILITPQNVSSLGQEMLNERLIHIFNPPMQENGIIINPRQTIWAGREKISYGIGDKIMLLQNDRERGLTNGMTGEIINIVPNPDFTGKATMAAQHDISLDFEELEASLLELQEAMGNAEDNTKEEEEENLRAASHIMTVKFNIASQDTELTKLELAMWKERFDRGMLTNDKMCRWSENVYDKNIGEWTTTDRAMSCARVKKLIDEYERDLATVSEGYRIVEFARAGHYKKTCHAYAVTCHKSQGSEYPLVLIIVHSAMHRLLTREWLYTALTRSSNKVVILYNNRGLKQALERQNIRGTTLEEKVKNFITLSEEGHKTHPVFLPKAKELVVE